MVKVDVVTISGQQYFDFTIQYEFPNLYCVTGGDDPRVRPQDSFFAQRMWLSADPNGQIRIGPPPADAVAWFEKGFWKPRLPMDCSLDYFYLTFEECIPFNPFIVTRTIGPFKLPQRTQIGSVCRVRAPDSCPAPGGAGGSSGGPGTGVFGPINVGSGDVSYSEHLVHVASSPVVAPSLDLTLGYASSQAYAGLFGTSWSSTLTQTVEAVPSTSEKLLRRRTAASFDEYYTLSATTGKWHASFPADLRGTIVSDGTLYTLTDLDGTAIQFEKSTSRWKSTTDRWGNHILADYAGMPNSFTVSDSQGRTLTFSLTGGLITQVQDSDGNIWRFSYTSGYLTQILDPFHLGSGFWRRYEYATVPGLSPNPLSAVKDEQNKVLEGFAYDPQGRAWMTFAEGNQNYGTLAYDTPSVGHTTVTTRIDNTPTNQVSVFDLIYQGGRYLATRINGNCASCSGADGDDQTFTYDTSNHAITRTVGIGAEQVQTINTYDANGMILTRTEVVGQPLLQRTTTFTYNYAGGTPSGGPPWPSFITSVSEASAVKPTPAQKVTSYSWNATGTRETTLTTDVSGYLLSGDASPITYRTTSIFDGASPVKHRLLEVDGPDQVGQAPSNRKTVYTYYSDISPTPLNSRGRLQMVAVDTSATAQLVTTYENYDVFGTAKKVVDPNSVETDKTTDARGRVLTVTSQPVPGDPNEAIVYTTTYTFDPRDRLTGIDFPMNAKLRYEYEDGTNRLVNTIRMGAAFNQRERLHLTLNVIGGKTMEEAQICLTPATTCND